MAPQGFREGSDRYLAAENGRTRPDRQKSGSDMANIKDKVTETLTDVATPANLIVNGSFEDWSGNTSKWSGWTGLTELNGWSLEGKVTKNTNWFEPHSTGYNGVKAADGRAMLDLGASPGNLTVSQTISGLLEGATYTLSFSVADSVGGNAVAVSFGGETLATLSGVGKTMKTYTFDIVASSSSATLSFAERGKIDNTGVYLDNVKLVQSAAPVIKPAPAPEPTPAPEPIVLPAPETPIVPPVLETPIEPPAPPQQLPAAPVINQVSGTDASEELYGSNGADVIRALGGHDYIALFGGSDTVDGGEGYDTVDYAAEGGPAGIKADLGSGLVVDTTGSTDQITGIERLIGSDYADFVTGSASADAVEAGGGNDSVAGGAGGDVLNGGFGNDLVEGGADQDTLVGGHGEDTLDGGDHDYDAVDYSQDGGWKNVSVDMTTGLVEDSWGTIDTLISIGIVKGTDLADWMRGGAADIIFDGKGGDDYLLGGSGRDELYGAAGNDTLTGGDNIDFLEGGMGDDILVGGRDGFDVFAFYMTDGRDTIVDFDEYDHIRLYNTGMTVEEVLAATQYHQQGEGGPDGLLVKVGETEVFLMGVYSITADRFELVNI